MKQFFQSISYGEETTYSNITSNRAGTARDTSAIKNKADAGTVSHNAPSEEQKKQADIDAQKQADYEAAQEQAQVTARQNGGDGSGGGDGGGGNQKQPSTMKAKLIRYGVPVLVGGAGAFGGIMIAKKMQKNKIVFGIIGFVVLGTASFLAVKKFYKG